MSDAEWEFYASRLPENEVKEKILAGYEADHSRWRETSVDRLKGLEQLRFGSVLDFGCGLGRNFAPLRCIFDAVDGYDLPAMVERLEADEPEVSGFARSVSSDWRAVRGRSYDLVSAILVFQHIPEWRLVEYLGDIAAMSPFLWVETRSWNDDGRKNNLEMIARTGLFSAERVVADPGILPDTSGTEEGKLETLVRAADRGAEFHCCVLLRSKVFSEGAKGRPPAPVLSRPGRPDDSDLLESIMLANFTYDVESFLPAAGGRPAGWFQRVLRRALKPLIGWYVRPVVDAQKEFNAHVTRSLNEMKAYVDRALEHGEAAGEGRIPSGDGGAADGDGS